MSEKFGILLMMNNYLHDVATALLLGSGAAMWLIYRIAVKGGDCDLNALRDVYRGMTKLAIFALVWIVVGGIPRTVFLQ